jgi:S-formylglutathione hydrolase FrmB
MGGYGALHIGFNNADTFRHVMALCPGLLDDKGLDKAVNQWTSEGWNDFLEGYAAAFAPDATRQQAPFGHAWNPDNKATRKMWESGFGALPEKVNAYLRRSEKLSSLRIEYGEKDPFVWITEGSRYLSGLLRQNKIDHEIYGHQGSHSIAPSAANIVDFFSRNLE